MHQCDIPSCQIARSHRQVAGCPYPIFALRPGRTRRAERRHFITLRIAFIPGYRAHVNHGAHAQFFRNAAAYESIERHPARYFDNTTGNRIAGVAVFPSRTRLEAERSFPPIGKDRIDCGWLLHEWRQIVEWVIVQVAGCVCKHLSHRDVVCPCQLGQKTRDFVIERAAFPLTRGRFAGGNISIEKLQLLKDPPPPLRCHELRRSAAFGDHQGKVVAVDQVKHFNVTPRQFARAWPQ